MKGLVLTPADRKVTLLELPTPKPGSGELLVRVHAVALNPVDLYFVDIPIAKQERRVIGTDFAGVVVEASADLNGSKDPRTKAGARVAGFLQGACSTNERPGAFAEYITVPYDLTWSVPAAVSLESASTVSMCGLTAAQGLFFRLGLPCPFTDSPSEGKEFTSSPTNIFIYGASTSLGLYVAQWAQHSAKVSGRKIRLIGVAAASNHDMLRGAPYNYDYIVDYKDKNWTELVTQATGGHGIDYAADCISMGETVYKTESLLNGNGSFAVFRGPQQYDISKLRVKPVFGAAWEGLGVEIGFGGTTIPAKPAARDFAVKFYAFLSSAVSDNELKIVPNPVRIMPGGLERMPIDGLAVLRGDRNAENEAHLRPISAEKLVYRV